MSRVQFRDRLDRKVTILLAAGFLLAAGVGCQGDRTAPAGRQPGPVSGPGTGEPGSGARQVQEYFPNRGRLVEDLSIGLVDGASEYVFGFIADIAAAPDGSTYVVDGQVGVVRQYDAHGRFVRSFGRKGTGPGEFNAPRYLAIHPDGRVLIADEGRSGAIGADRILVFSGDGTLLDTWSFPDLIEAPITVDTAGVVYVRINGELKSSGGPVSRPVDSRRAASLEPGARAVTWVEIIHNWHPPTSPGTIRLQPDGTVLDTIKAPASQEIPYRQFELATGKVYVGFQYTPFTWWAWSPVGHLLSGSSEEYAIDVHEAGSAAGALLRQLRRDVAPIPVVADERAETRDALDSFASNPGRWVGAVAVPTYKPAYHSVFVGREGRVWVGVHLPSVKRAGDWVEPMTAFDVWEPNGEYRGRVEGPATIREPVIDGDMLFIGVRDELGVERVVRYRVVWE